MLAAGSPNINEKEMKELKRQMESYFRNLKYLLVSFMENLTVEKSNAGISDLNGSAATVSEMKELF